MKKWLPFLAFTLCANFAAAEPPASDSTPTQKQAEALVEKQLIEPLARAEARRSRFSRAAPVPVVRRVRVLDSVAQADARGKTFVRFAVDVRRRGAKQGAWTRDDVLGCVYPDQLEVFVQSDDTYLPADSVLGKDAEPLPDVCRPAADADAKLAKATRS